MIRLDRYVAWTVTLMMVLAGVGLLGVLSLFTMLEQLESLRHEYNLQAVLRYMAYTTPRRFYELVPYTALIGCLAGLGMLASNSELVIMRAAGLSTRRLTLAATAPAILLVGFGLGLGEYVVPAAERIAQNDRARARAEGAIVNEFGHWYREGDVYMHFDLISRGGVLEGVSHYVFEDDAMVAARYAERAVYHDIDEARRYWLLEGVTESALGEAAASVRALPSLEWRSELTPQVLATEMLVQPDKLSIAELDYKIGYLARQELSTVSYELAYWRKILLPLSTVGLVFIAVSFVFGPLRESTMAVRVLSGLAVGVLYKFAEGLLGPLSLVYGIEPWIVVLLPILGCLGIGGWFMSRVG